MALRYEEIHGVSINYSVIEVKEKYIKSQYNIKMAMYIINIEI